MLVILSVWPDTRSKAPRVHREFKELRSFKPVTPCNTWVTETLSSEEPGQLSHGTATALRRQSYHMPAKHRPGQQRLEKGAFPSAKQKLPSLNSFAGVQCIRQIRERKNRKPGTHCVRRRDQKGGLDRLFHSLSASLPSLGNVWFSSVKLCVYFLL